MPRKHNVERTRRIIVKLLNGVLYKTIAFEEDISEARISYIKGHYIRRETKLILNNAGLTMLNGVQLDLLLENERKARYEILHSLGKDNKKDTWDQGI